MKKYETVSDLPVDNRLNQLLAQRRAPLSPEGMQKVLTDLTAYLCNDICYCAAIFPKKEVLTNKTIAADEIDKADIMLDAYNDRYFPVFTSVDKLKQWKPELARFEEIFIFSKTDLLSFLDQNEKVSACVVNPGEDDLLLFRMQLQNMIQLASGKVI